MTGAASCTPNRPGIEPNRVLILGLPSSKRVRGCSAALARMGYPPPLIVSYSDLLSGNATSLGETVLGLRATLPDGVVPIVRIDSPGECFDVERELLRLGIEPAEAESYPVLSHTQLDQLQSARGAIHRPRQWYLGFCRLLKRLVHEFEELPPVRWMAHPTEIPTLFDKRQCQDRWLAANLPVPKYWHHLRTYDQIREACRADHRRVMIKLAHGFSAMGAVALEWNKTRVRALTTVEVEETASGPHYFLSKQVQTLTDETKIAELVDRMGREGVLVDEWLPKARIDGMPFDLRVITIAGRAQHVVGRGSYSPFTNLNLDAHRIGADQVQARLGEQWSAALELCETAAKSFPKSLGLGVDLLIRSDRQQFALLEANAFGDLLPGITYAGRDTYEAQLAELLVVEEKRKDVLPASSVPIAGGLDAVTNSSGQAQTQRASPSTTLDAGSRDIVIITFDTLRYDVAMTTLQAGKTPFLASLLPNGWEERHAPGNFTYASHAAILAGFFPTPVAPGPHARPLALAFPGSQTVDSKTCLLEGSNIIEGLKRRGYYTLCIGGVSFFNPATPLGQIFPSMFDESHWEPTFAVTEPHSTWYQVGAAIQSMSHVPADRSLCLFINFSALHSPNYFYRADAQIDSAATQSAALEYVDRQLPRLWQALQSRGNGGTAFLMSDHGTAYGEDGYHGHRLGHPVVWTVPYGETTWEAAS